MVRSSTDEQLGMAYAVQKKIRKRAFEIHIERGGIPGCDLDGWLQIQTRLQQKYEDQRKGRQNEARRYG